MLSFTSAKVTIETSAAISMYFFENRRSKDTAEGILKKKHLILPPIEFFYS